MSGLSPCITYLRKLGSPPLSPHGTRASEREKKTLSPFLSAYCDLCCPRETTLYPEGTSVHSVFFDWYG